MPTLNVALVVEQHLAIESHLQQYATAGGNGKSTRPGYQLHIYTRNCVSVCHITSVNPVQKRAYRITAQP